MVEDSLNEKEEQEVVHMVKGSLNEKEEQEVVYGREYVIEVGGRVARRRSYLRNLIDTHKYLW
jgi:hypothetical protein